MSVMFMGLSDGIYGPYSYPPGGYGWSSDPCIDIDVQGAANQGVYSRAQLQAMAAGQTIINSAGSPNNAHLDEVCGSSSGERDQVIANGPMPVGTYQGGALPILYDTKGNPLSSATPAAPAQVVSVPAPVVSTVIPPSWAGTAPATLPTIPSSVIPSTNNTTAVSTSGAVGTAAPSWLPSFLATPLQSVSTSTGLSDTALLLIVAGAIGLFFYMGRSK